jgi:hypothetical protein
MSITSSWALAGKDDNDTMMVLARLIGYGYNYLLHNLKINAEL